MKIIIIVLCSISILFIITAIDYGFGVRSGRMSASSHMTVALIAAAISVFTHCIVIAFFPNRKKQAKEETEE